MKKIIEFHTDNGVSGKLWVTHPLKPKGVSIVVKQLSDLPIAMGDALAWWDQQQAAAA